MKTITNADDFDDRKRRIQEKRKKLLTQLNSILGKERSDENKKAARKANLLGGVILGEAAKNEKMKAWMTQFLDKRLTSVDHRALFDLPLITPKPEDPSSGNTPKTSTH